MCAATKLSALGFAAALAVSAGACPLLAPALQKGAVQATWAVDGAPITVGRHFSIDLKLCPLDAVLARVDASMPEHRHGMNYRTSLRPLGDGRWRAEGLLFHMPGRWELRLGCESRRPHRNTV